MTQHRSLRVDSVGMKHRNVLKRLERVKKLRKDGRWEDGKSSMYGMPKVKSQKIKVKSSSESKETAAEGAEASAETKAAPK